MLEKLGKIHDSIELDEKTIKELVVSTAEKIDQAIIDLGQHMEQLTTQGLDGEAEFAKAKKLASALKRKQRNAIVLKKIFSKKEYHEPSLPLAENDIFNLLGLSAMQKEDSVL